MDKLREQYKVHKEEEETKRQFYHSPGTAHREGVDGDDSSDQFDGSMEVSSHSELTPEPSPALNQRDEIMDAAPPSNQFLGQGYSQTSHKPKECPLKSPLVQLVMPGFPPQINGNSPGYNPYPPPTQAAPPSPNVVERPPSPQQPAPIPPQRVTPPTTQPTAASPDKEALFAFAWYHGSIPRDEALRRLEGVGGYDG